MQVSIEMGDPVDIKIHYCERAKIDEQFPGLAWIASPKGYEGKSFEHADLKIGGITIKFFT